MFLVLFDHSPHFLSLFLQPRGKFVIDVSEQIVDRGFEFSTGLLHASLHLSGGRLHQLSFFSLKQSFSIHCNYYNNRQVQ